MRFPANGEGVTQGVMMGGGLIGGVLAEAGKKLSIKKIHRLLLLIALCFVPIVLGLLLGVSAIIGYSIITSACFFAMIAGVLMRVQLFAFIQQVVPEEIMGKVFSCLMAINLCAQPIGQWLAGQLRSVCRVAVGRVIGGCRAIQYSIHLFPQLFPQNRSIVYPIPTKVSAGVTRCTKRLNKVSLSPLDILSRGDREQQSERATL